MIEESVYERKGRVRRRLAHCVGDLLSAFSPRFGSAESKPPHCIGVLLQWGIGDAVLTLPLLQGLHRAYPEASIELIGEPWLAELFAGEPWLNRTHLLVPPWTNRQGKYRIWEKNWWRFAGQLRVARRLRFNLLIGIRFDPREVLQLRLLNAGETAGFSSTGGRCWVTRDLDLTAETFNDRHRGEVSTHALEALTGIKASSIPRFQCDKAARAQALRRLHEAGYRGGPILAVHSGAGSPIRRWGIKNFNTVLKALPKEVQYVVLIDDNGDKGGRGLRVPKTVPSYVWRSGLAELKGLLSACDIFLCCESGVMHMAAACDCRVVAIFGSGFVGWFGPCGENHEVVKVDPMPCRPCFDQCIYPTPICMEGITIEAVSAALTRAFGHVSTDR